MRYYQSTTGLLYPFIKGRVKKFRAQLTSIKMKPKMEVKDKLKSKSTETKKVKV